MTVRVSVTRARGARSAAAFLAVMGIAAFGITFWSMPAAAFVCQDVVNGDGGLANATGGSSTSNMACGPAASATAGDQTSTAVGTGAQATGSETTALGIRARAGGDVVIHLFTNAGNTAVGGEAEAGSTAAGQINSTAVGAGATANVAGGTAIGQGASVTVSGSVALGQGSVADRGSTVSVGTVGGERQIVNVAAGTSGTDAVNLTQLNNAISGLPAIPFVANNANARPAPSAVGTDAVAGGFGATAGATNSTAIGNTATASANNSVALGFGSVANVANTVSVGAVGNERKIVNVAAGTIAANSTDAIDGGQLFTANQRVAAAFGGGAGLDANGQLTAPTYTIQAVNFNNVGGAFNAVDTALTTNSNNIAALSNTVSTINTSGTKYYQSNSTGPGASATGTNSLAMGSGAIAGASDAIATGTGAMATQAGAIAIGKGAASTGVNAIAIGTGATATGSLAVGVGASAANGGAALGDGAVATATSSTAVGPGAMATNANAVAIGSGSVTSAANTVSVGSAGNERRITNVAAGVSQTDAVNMGQLNGVATGLQTQINGLQGQVNDNRWEARGGIALALAAGGLRFDDRPGKLSVAGSFGNFKGASGLAVGVGYAATDRLRFNATVSGSPDQHSMGGVVGGSITLN